MENLIRAYLAFCRLWLLAWRYLVTGWWRWLIQLLGYRFPDTPTPTEQSAQDRRDARPVLRTDTDVTPEKKATTRGKIRTKKTAHAGAFVTSCFANPSGQRDYKLFIPDGKRDQRSLVVMLHGCKQNPDDFAAGTRMNDWACAHDFLVLYPAQSEAANSYGCWNWFSPKDRSREVGELSIIAGMVEAVMAEYVTHPERVFVAGLSAGAAMAVNLALMYPDLIRAAGVHSGLPFGAASDVMSAMVVMKHGVAAPPAWQNKRLDTAAKRQIAMMVFHGDQDEVVHPRNADALVAQALLSADADAVKLRPISEAAVASANGLAHTRHIYDDAGVRVEYWQVHGAGHAWSGGSVDGSYTEPRGPDASKEMLRFFFDVSGQSMASFGGAEPTAVGGPPLARVANS